MKLSTRFRLSATVSIAIILAVGLLLAWNIHGTYRAETALEQAMELQQQQLERSVIRSEYLLKGDERSRRQWNKLTARIEEHLLAAQATFSGDKERRILADLQRTVQRSKDLFAILDGRPVDGSSPVVAAELRGRVATQLSLLSYSMFTSAKELEDIASDQLIRVHRRTALFIGGMISLALGIILVNAWIIWKRIDQRVQALWRGVQRLSAGELGFRLGMVGVDELADLGRGFDVMAMRLQESRMALENEVQVRVATEAEVRTLNGNLESVVEALTQSNEELESFGYSVSHDLRAPLRHIIGYVALLRQHAAEGLDGESQGYLDHVTGSAERMANLIDHLLDYSRLGKTRLDMRTVALNTVVQEVRDDLAGEAGQDTVWEIAPLPDIPGDAEMLRQVWQNLIGNAIKFTRARRPARITIGADTSDPDEVHCFIRDNGAGFAMEHAGNLFGVFKRLHRVDEFEGTGIGLATVKRIVQRHGGRVWAEGAVDAGATFWFSLPSVGG